MDGLSSTRARSGKLESLACPKPSASCWPTRRRRQCCWTNIPRSALSTRRPSPRRPPPRARDCGPYTPDEDRKGHWYHDRAQAERLVRDGVAAGKLSVTLRGAKLKGSFALVRTARNPKDWLLIKHKDRFVAETDVTGKDHSVLSGLMVENLKAMPVRRMPASQLVPSGKKEALPVKLLP